jgi:carbonic anhydrase
MAQGTFATAINCMDGRTQLPVIEWLKAEYGVDYVDSVTEPGPVRILSEACDSSPAKSILGRAAVSINKHGSKHIAVVGHHDCAGNPADEATQMEQIRGAKATIRGWGFEAEVVGLWVDENWQVRKVT